MKIVKDFWVTTAGTEVYEHTATINGEQYVARFSLPREQSIGAYYRVSLAEIEQRLRSMMLAKISSVLYKDNK